jgi:hypothetical protein
MSANRNRPLSDFGEKLRAALAPKVEPLAPRSVEERAALWESGLEMIPAERMRHGMPDGHALRTLDEMFSLAWAVADSSSAEKAMFYTVVRSLARQLEGRDIRVRNDRHNAWRRLLERELSGSHERPVKRSVVCGVLVPVEDAQSGRLVDEWLETGDAVSHSRPTGNSSRRTRGPIDAAWEVLKQARPRTSNESVRLQEEDISLSLGWARESFKSAVNELLLRSGNDRLAALKGISWDKEPRLYNEIRRCLAARHAELLVLHVLRSWGRRVEDVSRLAASGSADQRWKTHDLEVDGLPVDVKNVTFRRDGFQTWTRVKQFRLQVRYDAARTRWAKNLESFFDEHPHVDAEYLGSLTSTDIATFSAMARPPLSIEVTDCTYDGGARFTGWCFALSEDAYGDWDDAFTRFVEALAVSTKDRPSLSDTQLAVLYARGVRMELRESESRLRSECVSLFAIAEMVNRYGRSPRAVVAAILNELQAHLSGQPRLSERLREQLFPFGKSAPLGVFDPSEGVAAFLESVLELVKAPTALAGIRSLQLMSPYWLRGRTESGESVTLIANCYDCGAYPLIRGRHSLCPHGTDRLRCENGHCCGA